MIQVELAVAPAPLQGTNRQAAKPPSRQLDPITESAGDLARLAVTLFGDSFKNDWCDGWEPIRKYC